MHVYLSTFGMIFIVAGYGLSEGFAPAAPNLPATSEERDIPGGDIVF